MSLNGISAGEVAFGPFRLDLHRRTIYRGTVLVPLGARAFDVLCVLASVAGQLVTKDELMVQVWPGTIVEENNIQVQIWALRKALGKDSAGEQYIVTVPGRGYRLVAEAAPRAIIATPTGRDGKRPSIAVLPFTNMTGDDACENFADGLVEDLTTELARLRWLHVIARNSSFVYKGQAVDLRQIGLELGARYVIEGSVRRSDDRVRVTAQLIEAETRAHIWAGNFNRDLGSVFALQDEITSGIIAAVEPSIRSTEIAWAITSPSGSTSPYELYLRALSDLYVQQPPNLVRAECLLRRAVELDPDYADALAALAECVIRQAIDGSVTAECMKAGRTDAVEHAERAVLVDPANSRALAAAGYALSGVHYGFDEGLEMASRAAAVNPGSAHVHNARGQVFVTLGESEKALTCFEEARRLNPFYVHAPLGITLGVTMAHFLAGRFEDAVKWGQRAVAEEPGRASPRRFVAAALAHLGRIEEARAQIPRVLRSQPTSSLARSSQVSFQPAWAREIYVDGLRRAGLPEHEQGAQ